MSSLLDRSSSSSRCIFSSVPVGLLGGSWWTDLSVSKPVGWCDSTQPIILHQRLCERYGTWWQGTGSNLSLLWVATRYWSCCFFFFLFRFWFVCGGFLLLCVSSPHPKLWLCLCAEGLVLFKGSSSSLQPVFLCVKFSLILWGYDLLIKHLCELAQFKLRFS